MRTPSSHWIKCVLSEWVLNYLEAPDSAEFIEYFLEHLLCNLSVYIRNVYNISLVAGFLHFDWAKYSLSSVPVVSGDAVGSAPAS